MIVRKRQPRWRRSARRFGGFRMQNLRRPRQMDMPLGEVRRAVPQSTIRSHAIWFLIVLGLLIAQTMIKGVKPDLVLLAVLFAAMHRGPCSAAITGFVAGMFQDAHSASLLGTHAFCAVVVGTVTGFLTHHFYRERIEFQLIMAFIATLFAQLTFLGL